MSSNRATDEAGAGGSSLLGRNTGRSCCSFDEPSLNRTGRWMLYLRLCQPGSHFLPQPSDSMRPHPTQLLDPSKMFPIAFQYELPVQAQDSDFTNIFQISSIWPQHAPYILLSGHRPGTINSQPWFATWPHLGTSKPSASSNHLQITL